MIKQSDCPNFRHLFEKCNCELSYDLRKRNILKIKEMISKINKHKLCNIIIESIRDQPVNNTMSFYIKNLL